MQGHGIKFLKLTIEKKINFATCERIGFARTRSTKKLIFSKFSIEIFKNKIINKYAMKEFVMLLSSVLFAVLFVYIVLIFLLYLISTFFNRKAKDFKPDVSIVVPAYNEEKNIKECLSSICSLNYPKNKLEVIVVDDGSKDSTISIIRKFKNVKLVKQRHLGKVEALNSGVRNSSFPFIFTVDSDTTPGKDCLRDLIRPFADKNIGATTGNNRVKNSNSLLTWFQAIEYSMGNLIRNSFSTTFNNGIWFSGSLACYRRSVLERVGFFKKDTMAEDQDIALEIKKAGYKTICVSTACGHTIVPSTIMGLYRQRVRWWIGALQSMIKNKELFSISSSPSIIFLYVNQFWWSFYAFLSLPLIIFQISYWLPYNSQSAFSLLNYLFRWFSLMGPAYVIYKIPEWGVSSYTIFGVLSGIITTLLSLLALRMFKEKITFKNMFAIFFYFPYTIVLNIMILVTLLRHKFWKSSFYIK